MDDLFRARDQVQDKVRVSPVHQVIVQGIDITQRVWLDILRNGRGIAALGDAVRVAGNIREMEEVLHQTVVRRVVQGNEGLDPRVAEVLELLVVRAVHIGFPCAQAGGTPADFQHLLQFRVPGIQLGGQFKGIAGESTGQAAHRQRLIGRLHQQPDIAERAPAESGPRVFPSVRKENILPADEYFPINLVPVALARTVREIEGFGITDTDLGAFPAAEEQTHVGIG